MADLEGEESIEIDAPIERCFEIAADVERAPEWHGAMRSAKVLERDEHGRPLLVESEYDALVARVLVCLRFGYEEPVRMTWSRSHGDLKALDGGWTLQDLGGGRTRATYRLEIGLNRALGLLRKGVRGPAETRVRQLLARRPVEGLKARAEAA